MCRLKYVQIYINSSHNYSYYNFTTLSQQSVVSVIKDMPVTCVITVCLQEMKSELCATHLSTLGGIIHVPIPTYCIYIPYVHTVCLQQLQYTQEWGNFKMGASRQGVGVCVCVCVCGAKLSTSELKHKQLHSQFRKLHTHQICQMFHPFQNLTTIHFMDSNLFFTTLYVIAVNTNNCSMWKANKSIKIL